MDRLLSEAAAKSPRPLLSEVDLLKEEKEKLLGIKAKVN